MVTSNEFQQALKRLDALARSVEKLAKIAEAANETYVGFTRKVIQDIENHEFKPVELKDLTPRYQVGMAVVIYKEGDVREGWRGTIVELSSVNAKVNFPDGNTGFYRGDEIIPMHEFPQEEAGVVEPPMVDGKYVPDEEGRLFPDEWRKNFNFPAVELDPINPEPHELEPMTEEAFRIYNAGVEGQ